MLDRNSYRRFLTGLVAATTVLVAGMVLLVVTSLDQTRSTERTAQLQADTITALSFQFEREFLRLRNTLALDLTEAGGLDDEQLQLRYDIFLSRLDLLATNRSTLEFQGTPEYRDVYPRVKALVERMEPALRNAPAHRAELQAFLEELNRIGPDVQSLSYSAIALVSNQIRRQVDTLRDQSLLIVGLASLMALLMVLAAVVLALRQKRQFETQLQLQRLNGDLLLARQEALEASRRAEEVSQSKSRFLANMSHELRTPFNGMLGMLDLLRDSELAAPQRDHLNTAIQSASHLLVLLNDILDVSAIEAGKLKIKLEPVYLPSLLREAADMMREQARAKGLEFRVDLDPALPLGVRTDPTRLRQVIFNLLSNAIKFTPRGWVKLEVRVRAQEDDRQHLEVTVQDTGIGIGEQAQRQLFQPFYQVDSSAQRRSGGTGLGLNISHTVAQLLGGSLSMVSQEGRGSTFTFVLPLHPCDPPASQMPMVPFDEPADLPAPLPEARPSGDLQQAEARILVADDNAINQTLARALLAKLGHGCVVVDNGQQAFEAVRDGDFDLVLMDMQMPEVDGPTSTRRIRALPGRKGRLPVVALTANAMDEAKTEALDAGMNELLVKPVRLDALRELLQRYLSSAASDA